MSRFRCATLYMTLKDNENQSINISSKPKYPKAPEKCFGVSLTEKDSELLPKSHVNSDLSQENFLGTISHHYRGGGITRPVSIIQNPSFQILRSDLDGSLGHPPAV